MSLPVYVIRVALRRCIAMFFLSIVVGPLYGQVADTTRANQKDVDLSADSVKTLFTAPEDSLLAPVGFPRAADGVLTTKVLPVKMLAMEPPDALSNVPGAFVYDFGTPGWPDGWSPYGLDPNTVALLFDGASMNDLITGRPRYDLIPFTLLKPLRLRAARDRSPMTVVGQMREFNVVQPLTEMRYRTSNTGLQSVTVVHVQQRHPLWFGRPTRVNVLFGYGGHAARGEYGGSRLRRARQVLGRIRIEQRNWSLEIKDLFNRRRVGAQGGVLPFPGAGYESIYQRLGALVDKPEAKRETFRNDLFVTVNARLFPGVSTPFTISGSTSGERFQYRNTSDTLTARIGTVGLRIQQDIRHAGHRLRLRIEGAREHTRAGRALPDSLGLSRSRVDFVSRDTLDVAGIEFVIEGGLHHNDGVTFPSGFGRLGRERGGFGLFVEASHTGQPVSWIEQFGYGGTVQPIAGRPDGRISQGRAGFSLRWHSLDATLFGFATVRTRPITLYVSGTDSIAARVGDGTWRRAGLGGTFGWRRGETRGLYFTAQPTVQQFLDVGQDPDRQRADAALPAFFANGRFGARFVVFQRDLDIDVSLRGRYWSQMRSRTLHPQTGLLVVPNTDARLFRASGTLDFVFESSIRGARLFLAYENFLSGSSFQIGNLIVPDYPLPQRRFRFGVYWPIMN